MALKEEWDFNVGKNKCLGKAGVPEIHGALASSKEGLLEKEERALGFWLRVCVSVYSERSLSGFGYGQHDLI